MPLFRTLGVHVPVILVASKLDLAENSNDELVEVSLFACLQRREPTVDTAKVGVKGSCHSL